MDTRDWVDGLFSNIFREMNRPTEREVMLNKLFLFYFIFLCFFEKSLIGKNVAKATKFK